MRKPCRLATPLLGPNSPGAIAFEDGAFVTQGEWEGVRFTCRLALAELRQSNCYYSSSDAAFADRYEAGARYNDIHTGAVGLKGGWRIYSSGPGIFLGLITLRLLGVRPRFGQTVLDPVIPAELDGLTARMDFRGRTVEFTYHVTGPGAGPREIRINDNPVTFDREANPYRPGGALIPDAVFEHACDRDVNSVEIAL